MVEYTFGEIEQHNRRDDCWLIIHGKVYEVTNFKDHPGGPSVLADNAGKDATEAFTRLHKHSHDAKERMKRYCIGDADMTAVSGRSYNISLSSSSPSLPPTPPESYDSPDDDYVSENNAPNQPHNIPRIKVWQLFFILLLAAATEFFWPILVILVWAYADGKYTIEN